MYDYRDFYNEPNEFEQKIDEFKQSLMNAVKDEYKAEMERLRKENSELQEVKRNLDQIKQEYNQKMHQLDIEKRELKNEVRKERLLDLMGDFKVELFRAYSSMKDGPKCDKCDEDRNIYYKSPLGKQMVEKCDCKNNITYYEPRSYVCSEYELRDGTFIAWYKPYLSGGDGMELDFFESSTVPQNIYSGEDFDLLGGRHYNVFFKTEEECQAYCDWLSDKYR